MSDGEPTEPPTTADPADSGLDPGDSGSEGSEGSEAGIFSHYGVASAVLGVLSVAAVVLGGVIWSGHRAQMTERSYLGRVMVAAADWASVLINMNSENIGPSLQRLHDETVGELNADFDATVQPYRLVVEKLQSKSVGRVDAVAIETVRHDLDTHPGAARPPGSELVATTLPPFATRTDSVMLVATSISENVGAKPQTVHWSLQLDVSDVDGKLMISGLASIR